VETYHVAVTFAKYCSRRFKNDRGPRQSSRPVTWSSFSLAPHRPGIRSQEWDRPGETRYWGLLSVDASVLAAILRELKRAGWTILPPRQKKGEKQTPDPTPEHDRG
jgi:hypothetical protein